MAVIVTTKGTTKVKKVVVGRPVKRINSTTGNINNLAGVDTTGANKVVSSFMMKHLPVLTQQTI